MNGDCNTFSMLGGVSTENTTDETSVSPFVVKKVELVWSLIYKLHWVNARVAHSVVIPRTFVNGDDNTFSIVEGGGRYSVWYEYWEHNWCDVCVAFLEKPLLSFTG